MESTVGFYAIDITVTRELTSALMRSFPGLYDGSGGQHGTIFSTDVPLASLLEAPPQPQQKGAATRIRKEILELQKLNDADFGATLVEANPWLWHVFARSPNGPSPYAGGTFLFDIHIPTDYPFKPPRVRLLTATFHTSITPAGVMDNRIQKDHWSPALTIHKLVKALVDFSSWKREGYLNPEAIILDESDPQKFSDTAREFVQKYAR